MRAYLQVFKKDEATFENQKLSPENRWSYYISSFTNLEPTEGVPISKIHMPILWRGLVQSDENSDEVDNRASLVSSSENLVIRVCLENYKMLFAPRTDEWMIQSQITRSGGEAGLKEMQATLEKRAENVEATFLTDNRWIKGAKKDDVEAAKAAFDKAVKGPDAEKAEKESDEEMADAS